MTNKDKTTKPSPKKAPAQHPSRPPAERTNGTFLSRSERWLGQNRLWVLIVLLLSWTGIRIAFYSEFAASPLYSMYKFSESDNLFFSEWGKQLTHDPLNTKPFHPYHDWHKKFSDRYLLVHPEKAKELTEKNPKADPGIELWNEWYGGSQYHQEPLYAYLLAGFYALGLDAIRTMILLQLFLGVLTGWMLFVMARKFFGETAAVLTGIFYLMSSILFYNEIILLRTSWSVFFTVLILFLMEKALSKNRRIDYFYLGLALGGGFLLQSTFLLYLLFLVPVLVFQNRNNLLPVAKNGLVLLAGFLIILVPLVVRNVSLGISPLNTSSVGPVTYIISNTFGTSSPTAWLPDAEKQSELIGTAHESLNKAIRTSMATFPSFGDYLSLEWAKFKSVWSGIEYPNNENYYFYNQFLSTIRFAFLNFFFFAPIGLAGLLFALYNGKKAIPFYLAILVQLIVLMTFYVLARFRTPLVVVLLPFAAYALIDVLHSYSRTKKEGMIKTGVLALLVLLSYSAKASVQETNFISNEDYQKLYKTHFEQELKKLELSGQWEQWLKLQKELMDMQPDFLDRLGSPNIEVSTSRLLLTELFIQFHKERKRVYEILKDSNNIRLESEKIDAMNSFVINAYAALGVTGETGNTDAVVKLADSYRSSGRQNEAAILLQRALKNDPNNPQLHYRAGLLLFDAGNFDSASVHLETSYNVIKNDADIITALAANQFMKKNYASAIDLYKKAIDVNPDHDEIYSNTAACYLVQQKYDSGFYYLRKGLSLQPTEKTYRFIAAAFRETGQRDSAAYYEQLQLNFKGK